MAAQDSGMRARLDLQLRQKLVMTPQLQQAIRLLQLSRMELAQEIQQIMLENPLVEEATTDSQEESPGESSSMESDNPIDDAGESLESSDEIDLKWESYYDDEERERMESDVTWEAPEERPSYEQTLARPTTLSEHLLWQLGLGSLSEEEKDIGRDIIGNINDDGYLDASLEEIVKERGNDVSPEKIEAVLKVIQGFDPLGVGARTLVECLMIQVQMLNASDPLIVALIKNHLEDIEKRRYSRIAEVCSTSVEEVMHASKIIERLEPKPGRPFFSNENFSIIPDAYVVKVEGNRLGEGREPVLFSDRTPSPQDEEEQYMVVLNDDGLPKLRISPYYQSLLKSSPSADTAHDYLEEKFRSALWFIRSIEQRNRTTLKVAESILKFQYAFMKNGVGALKPLVLRQVAEDIEMHESTVSRATTKKYMHTPQGIYEFKFFFNSSVGGDQEMHSSKAVRDAIERLVAEEPPENPLTDQMIVEKLRGEGVEIARRTVSKYRFELKIAAASQRKRCESF